MAELASGALSKMKTQLDAPVRYELPVGEALIALNPYLGKKLKLTFADQINCVSCGRKTKKSFAQGYCFPCFKSKAACDLCIMSPERCHFDAGTCREPEWAQLHCHVDHFVYLANSSGIKVGITRHTQVPTRWIDQGARQALPLFRVSTRLQSGLLEVMFKEHVADKTHWQRMLKGDAEERDMHAVRSELLPKVQTELEAFVEQHGQSKIRLLEDQDVVEIQYPILEYPKKVVSKSFDKVDTVEGTLQGIKGQYLIFDTGVLNVRKFGGYHVSVFDD